MADNKQKLFADFPAISTEEWMAKVTADLKGADFERKLVWRTNEGFNVRPFYREEDLEKVSYLDTLPGEFPFTRGNDKKGNDWLVRQDIVVSDVQEANKVALDILMKGVTSLGFVICNKAAVTVEDFTSLLSGIDASCVEINLVLKGDKKESTSNFITALKGLNQNLETVTGSINFDPLGDILTSGSSCCGYDKIGSCAKGLFEVASQIPNFKTVTPFAQHFNNAGSSIVQELGFGLAMGAEYLSIFTDAGISIDTAAKSVKFNFAVSSNFFMEIAKLRAARTLWANIVSAYKPENADSAKMTAHSVTSEWNKTVFDPYVNMLRTQTEAMSATLGGTNSLTVQPFNKVFQDTTVFSDRIARNQQLLLKEESYFDKVADAGAGSYYIESLTDSISEQAWVLFTAVEEKGGFYKALEAKYIQDLVGATAAKRKEAIAKRREVFLGTNQFPNITEVITGSTELYAKEPTCGCCCGGDKVVEPIELFRGADEFETLRMATEKAAKRPKVFMLKLGNIAFRQARAQFSGNFFGCAGYDIIENSGFNSVEEGIAAAKEANAEIIVICSSDDEYATIAVEAYEMIKDDAIFVVAGAPACADDLKSKGIVNFVNVRSNVLEELKKYNQQLGIQ